MATVREIKSRIGSVKNIAQVTRALEAVSASRVRRAQEQVLHSRAYSQKAWEVLVNVAEVVGANEHPLLAKRDTIRAVDIILITSDRSLCGAYNNNIIRTAERFAATLDLPNEAIRWIPVGRKGRDYLVRGKQNVVAEFGKLGSPSFGDILPIGQIAVNDFLAGTVDAVFVAYTDFVNTLTQRPTVVNLLPLNPYTPATMVQADYLKPEPQATSQGRTYEFEPSAAELIDEIVPRFTALQVYQAVLESLASEHSARMVAMRNASENAIALVSDLTLEYNKARQQAITSEILDIVGGANALEATLESQAVKAADKFIHDMGGALKAEQQNRR
jgi:F-type H+-transporting ATPase subunit gamma